MNLVRSECKVHVQNSLSFLYNNNWKTEEKIKFIPRASKT